MLNKYFYPLLIIIFACLLGWQLFRPGYFPMHDDLQVMRAYQMDRCFQDGQIPCRFSPDMGYGYGQPMFNYYSAFPYYLGELIHLLGFSFVNSVKTLFLLSLILSGLFMYFFVRQILPRSVAFLAALAFIAAPYHALDIYVRGAMSEVWALTLLPAVFGSFLYLIAKPNASRGALFSLALMAFTTSHNLSSIINLPILFSFGLLTLIFKKVTDFKTWTHLITASVLGLGLAAFFIVPIAFERHLISQDTLIVGYFDFHGHFVSLRQLFLPSNWGYGPSKFGVDDDISFYFGFLPLVSILLSPFVLYKTFSAKKYFISATIIFFALVTLAALFLTHFRSTPIWDAIDILNYVQFPWRFLGPAMFASALLVGCLPLLFKPGKLRTISILILTIILFTTNFSCFKFEKYFYWIDDAQKLTGELYRLQISAAITDYLPVSALDYPKTQAPSQPYAASGEVRVDYFDHRSNYFATEVEVVTETAQVVIPIVYFPHWQIHLNHQVDQTIPTIYDPLGEMSYSLPQGRHLIQGWFEDTKVRDNANLITFTSALLLLVWLAVGKQTKKSQP